MMEEQHIPMIRYDDNLLKKIGDVQKYIKSHYARKLLTWVLNSKYRDAVQLEKWLEAQVSKPSESVLQFMESNFGSRFLKWSHDEIAWRVMDAVQDQIQYVTDNRRWGMPEKWATADETLTATTVVNGVTFGPMQGDCEDGSILIYVVCRLMGVPKESLFLWAGDVVGGGHCCCVYRPKNYPFQFAFMDWCYWKSKDRIDMGRFLYNIDGNAVIGERVLGGKQTGAIDRNYQKMWFIVNEEESFLTLKYEVV